MIKIDRKSGRKNKTKSKILLFLMMLMFLTTNTNIVFAATEKQYTLKRFWGQDRYETSFNIAKEFESGFVDNVIVANGNNFPDALTGSVLSKKLKAPILLVDNKIDSSKECINYIKDHLKKDGKIYVLGGIGAISDEFINHFNTLGFKNITRLGGIDRFGTNKKIIDEFAPAKGTPIIIANGYNFADALSISSIAAVKGYPIFISESKNIPDSIKSKISELQPSKVYLVGGNSVLTDEIVNNIKLLTSLKDADISRIGGQDRYDTSLKICNTFNIDTDSIVIANGENFPDALSGSALAAKNNSPIILADGKNIANQKKYIDGVKYKNVLLLGGNASIDKSVEDIFNSGSKEENHNSNSSSSSGQSQSSSHNGTSSNSNDSQNNSKTDDSSKKDEVAVPTVIKTDKGDIQINMNMTETEKQMTVVEGNPSLKEKIGESGFVGDPISIYSPVKSVDANVTVSYADKDTTGIDEKNIRLFYYNPNTDKLELVANQNVDTKNKVVNAKLTHFSTYILADISVWDQYISKNLVKPETNDPNVISLERNPMDIAFVIDSSGSMGPGDGYEFNQDLNKYRISGTKRLIDSLMEEDRAAIVDFDSSAILLSKLISDKNELKRAADKIDSYGGTDIPCGLKAAVDELTSNGRSNVKKTIVLLTDGKDYPYPNIYARDNEVQRAKKSGITINVIGLGNNIATDYLKYISNETNGNFYYSKDSQDLNNAMDIIGKNSGIDINKDSDGDGIPDWIEKSGYYFEGLNGKYIPPTNPESKDTDGDGYTDAEELGSFYYDKETHKVFISRDSKYASGPDKKPYQSNPNNAEETPESWMKPSSKYNSKLARVLAYSSQYAYNDNVNDDTVLKKNTFTDLKTISKFKLNLLNGTMEDMEALVGYKELSNGRKAILISFRGTQEKIDWITDTICALSKPQTPYENEKNVRLHAGFSDYSNAFVHEMKNTILADVNLQELINDNTNGIRNDVFLITGHSLGGAAAEVFAGHLKNEGIKNISCYTFAAPPIAFTGEEYFDDINIKRIYNNMDPVVNIPGLIPINTGTKLSPNYEFLNHVNTGIELPLVYQDKEFQQINKTIEEYNKKGLWDKITGIKDYLSKRINDEFVQFHNMSNVYLEYLDRIKE